MTLNLTLNKILILLGAVAVVLLLIFWFWWNESVDLIINNKVDKIDNSLVIKSPISGISCETADQRPIAIMLAGDPETRPLSGLNAADIVFEMPVTPDGITRFMAVFQCSNPPEIGSIRSAREDFIPLAAGLGAIYAHWGGEKEALAKLDSHIIDNIDGLKFDGTVFYRKNGVPRPHNGFTDLGRIIEQAKKFNYSLENKFSGYLHEEQETQKNLANIAEEITVNYNFPYNVKWVYNRQISAYERFRGDKQETDKNGNNSVSTKVVIVMKTKSTYLNKDYIKIHTQGEGDALIYQGGMVQSGRWKKDPSTLDSKLNFYDNNGKEISFLPGNKWVEIVVSSD